MATPPKTKKKTKKKKKAKAVEDGASEADFLMELATQPTEKAKKGEMPLVEMPQHAEAIATLVDAVGQIEKFTAIKTEMMGAILDDAEKARVAASRAAGEALGSIKVDGGMLSVNADELAKAWQEDLLEKGVPETVVKTLTPPLASLVKKAEQRATKAIIRLTRKNAYSGMNLMQKSSAVETLAESLPCDSEVAEEMFNARTKMVTTISLKPAAFKDKAAIVAMKKYLKPYLMVKVVAKPTDDFHRQATLQPNEERVMEILSDFLNPHQPTVVAKNVKR